MTSSKLITGEELGSAQPWRLPDVHDRAKRSSSVEDLPATEISPLTAEQIEQIQLAAQREGYAAGRQEGMAAARKEIQQRMQRFEQIMRALAAPLEDVDAQVEEELVALALTVARQIIRRELKTHPGEVVAVVREALAALPSASHRVQVYLHPDDAVLVHEYLNPVGEDAPWRIVEDSSLSRGGCRISSEHSRVDATVEKRIAAITARLLGGERSDDIVSEQPEAK